MDEVKITVIGAGVVGLAIAAELSREYTDIIVLERHDSFGRETSSRNSEVIHSGIYYPSGSLKAKLCVEGADILYKYCEKNSVPYSRLGKLIIAGNELEKKQLEDLYAIGCKNGVLSLAFMNEDEVKKMEPYVKAVSALYSPNTGIINSHSLMDCYYRQASSAGVMFSFESDVNYIERNSDKYIVGVKEDGYKFISSVVINSSGLCSDDIAGLAGINVSSAGYKLQYCKGSYFYYGKKSPVKMLIYPVPHKDLKGLGVHATLDLSGRLRFGPDTEDVNTVDYNVDENKRDLFYEGANKIISGLEKESFYPDTAGIRPKIKGTGIKDFIIRHEADKGLKGFINLIGIESPGLTASLSIARYVKGIVNNILN